MTTFSYSSGDPANLVAAGTASMADIKGPLDDIKTFFNAATIDTTNLATSAKPVTILGEYRTVGEAAFWLSNTTTGVYLPTLAGSQPSGTAVASTNAPVLVSLNSSDFLVSGLTTKLRLSVLTVTNATASGVTFTYGLYPVTVAGGVGQLAVTAGTVVSGSTVARASPAASSTFRDETSDFTVPSSGAYALGVSLGGIVSANAVVAAAVRLQVHHI